MVAVKTGLEGEPYEPCPVCNAATMYRAQTFSHCAMCGYKDEVFPEMLESSDPADGMLAWLVSKYPTMTLDETEVVDKLIRLRRDELKREGKM